MVTTITNFLGKLIKVVQSGKNNMINLMGTDCLGASVSDSDKTTGI